MLLNKVSSKVLPTDERPPPYVPEPSYTTTTWTAPHTWNNPTTVDNTSLEVQQYRRENIHLQAEVDQLRQQLQHNSFGSNGWLAQQNEELHRQVAHLTQEVPSYNIL